MLFMKRLLLFAFYRKQSDKFEILQAERFEHDTILFADVERMDLKRFDTRYISGQRCVPSMYFLCQPEPRQIEARQSGLQDCGKVIPVQEASATV